VPHRPKSVFEEQMIVFWFGVATKGFIDLFAPDAALKRVLSDQVLLAF
jgi:hypothetical protein